MPDEPLSARLWGGTRSDAFFRGCLLGALGVLLFALRGLVGATGGWIGMAALIVPGVVVVFGAMEFWNWRSLPDDPPSTN